MTLSHPSAGQQDRKVHCAEGEIGGMCILNQVIGYNIGTEDVFLRSIDMSLGRGEVHHGGGERRGAG